MFKNLKIANALLGFVLVFLSLVVLLGGLGYWSLNHINSDVQNLYRKSVQQNDAINATTLSLLSARTDLVRYATRVTQDRRHENAAQLTAREHLASAEQSMKQLEDSLLDSDKSLVAPLIQSYYKLSDNLRTLDRILEDADMDAFRAHNAQSPQDEFMAIRAELMTLSEREGQNTMQSISTYYSLFTQVLTVALLLSLAISVGVNLMARRLIVLPLQQISELFRRIAAGDLTNRITEQGRNEVGTLFASLKSMQDSLAVIVAQVRTGVSEIHIGTREISIGNVDLSSRTEEQAAALQETAASMEELAATVKQNADNARQADSMVITSSSVAKRGGTVVASVVETMGTISDSSSRISEIVGVIDSIAFQTNILALNAAVEAARAGEEGKGFAVVAAEVRVLAQRSAAAAREIKLLIDDSVQKVSIGTDQVANAGATMQEIVESVARVTSIMSEISLASEEQASGIDQVNTAVSQMDGVTQQNAALVEQAAAAAGALEEQTRNLTQAVAIFKLPSLDIVNTQPQITH